MTRLATLAALLVALLFVANAAAFRTTITTMEIDKDIDNPRRRGEGCREQIQRQQNLNHCQYYLRQQSRSGGYDEDNQRQHFRQCCQQLSQMDEQCQCEGLRQVVRRQQQQQGLRGEEMEEMVQSARDLPNECGISSQRCEIRRSWF